MPRRSCLVGLHGTGIVSDQRETSRAVGIELELKNTSDRLRHDGGVTRTFILVHGSKSKESQRLDSCRRQDSD